MQLLVIQDFLVIHWWSKRINYLNNNFLLISCNEIFHAFYLSTVITSSNFAKSHHISKYDEIILSKTACDFFNNSLIYFLTSQESFPPAAYPAHINILGMCSTQPASRYIFSHIVLFMMGRSTSCMTDGNGPSKK